MKISSDIVISAVKTAIAEQRAATLALDADRISAANTRLEVAFSAVKNLSATKSTEQPLDTQTIRQLQQALSVNAEFIQLASGQNTRALQTFAAAAPSSTPTLYAADGGTNSVRQSQIVVKA
jgi:flagellar biosynthesis/type III secretory pathway chaperone